MTSKEALDYLFEMFQKYAPFQDIEGFSCHTKESNKWFDSIIICKKDLEVLEIIRRNIYSSDDSLSLIMDDLRDGKDFYAIKEWLDEGKNLKK